MVIAAKRQSSRAGDLAKAILHAQWVLDQDISDPETLVGIARELDFDAHGLLRDSWMPHIRTEYERYTHEAINAGVFGSPSYVYKGELFWGQDRLDFLERALAADF